MVATMSEDQEAPSEFQVDTDEDELPEEVSPTQLNRISLSSTDWTTETILNQLERGNIDLSPRFQRRDAWQRERKSRFIESLILNLPVPQIVLAERKDQRGKFLVLDGKQRLTALLKFAGKASEGEHLNGFTLSKLEVLSHLNGMSYEKLVSDESFRADLDAFHNQTIRTVVIRNWDNDALLHLIFVRLNTSNVPLAAQELRQALFPGDFVNYVDDVAFHSVILKEFMGLQHADYRMRDVEILLRYLAFHFFIDTYSGNMSKFLNDTTKWLNGSFEERKIEIDQAVKSFESALQAAIEIFTVRHVARTWNGHRFETGRNRAILDVLLFYFSDPAVREEAVHKKDAVVTEYKRLSEKDFRFRVSTFATTGSLSATQTRFKLWGESLRTILDTPVDIPDWSTERIRPGAQRT
jgi:hypothetical protein